MNKNLLLFGGTFNPIHNGHLITSRHAFESLKEELNFDKITLVPNGSAPHKNNFIPAEHRLEMCKMAVKDNDIFEVCDYETKKDALSYTIDTIQYFKDKFDQIYMLIGPDTLKELQTWHRTKELITLCKFVVMYDDISDLPVYHSVSEHLFVKIPRIDIRSTLIRERIKQNLSISYFVPPTIESYIKENGLYL